MSLMAWFIAFIVHKFLYYEKSREFNKYLKSDEIKTIKGKYFAKGIAPHFLIMNRIIIDNVNTLCVFPLKEYSKHLIDERFFNRFAFVINRSYFKYLFYIYFLNFSRFMKRFYTIRNSFESEGVLFQNGNIEKQETPEDWVIRDKQPKIQQNIERLGHVFYENYEEGQYASDSSEEHSSPVDIEIQLTKSNGMTNSNTALNPEWLKEKPNMWFLTSEDFYCTSLYLCSLINNYLLSDSIFSPASERFIVCLTSPLRIEFIEYKYQSQGFNLVDHVIFDFAYPNALETLSYVLENLTSQSDGSEINVLLRNLDSSGPIPRTNSRR